MLGIYSLDDGPVAPAVLIIAVIALLPAAPQKTRFSMTSDTTKNTIVIMPPTRKKSDTL